jgi:CelD/BcsL family acetyltransferase involved in cellulose biosynthesis
MPVRLLAGFDDLPAAAWADLLERSPTPVVFLTRGWLEAWWQTLGQGTLLLVVAERDGHQLALAPLYVHGEVISFLGTDSSDYLDFLGDISEPAVLDGLLVAAREAVAASAFRLAVVPEHSPTTASLAAAATRLGLGLRSDEPVLAPALQRARLVDATRKKSLVRHENWFRRNGELSVVHMAHGRAILPQLDRFFAQHIERCTAAPYPSLFENERHRAFYRQLAEHNADAGWLRFTRVDWDDMPIAYHFGMSFRGSFLWYKPSFELSLARRSPGEVLLRQLLIAAYDEGAHTFDFGIGDEAFKHRFATSFPRVRTWTLTPR